MNTFLLKSVKLLKLMILKGQFNIIYFCLFINAIQDPGLDREKLKILID